MKNLNYFFSLTVLLFISITGISFSQMVTPWNLTGGGKIFFVKQNSTGATSDLYVMNPDGSNVTRLSNFGDLGYKVGRPKISSNGKYLTFISNYESFKSRFEQDVFLLDLKTGQFKRLTGEEWEGTLPANLGTLRVHYQIPSSPGKISYKGCNKEISVNYNEVVTINNVPAVEIWVKAVYSNGVGVTKPVVVKTTGVTDVYMDSNEGTSYYDNASPSPDGSEIAATFRTFNLTTQYSTREVKIINANGGFIDFLSPYYRDAAFSNDGSQLIFSVGVNQAENYESLAYLNTSNYNATPTIIAQGQLAYQGNYLGYNNGSWSPDNKKIVYQKSLVNHDPQTGNALTWNICTYNFITHSQTELTNYSGKYGADQPCFSPDSKEVVFVRITSKNNQLSYNDLLSGNYTTSIYKLTDLSTGFTAPLITDGKSSEPTWGTVEGGEPGIQTTILEESFNGDSFPPEGWYIRVFNKNKTWDWGSIINHVFRENVSSTDDSLSAYCPWTEEEQDEFLISPSFALGNGQASLEFYALYNSYWLKGTTLILNLFLNNETAMTELWRAADDGDTLKWRKITVDLSAHSGQSNLNLGWEVFGNNGDIIAIDGIKLTGVSGVTGFKTDDVIPTKYYLSQNYPNPFNPTTTIIYEIPKQSIVQLKVFDVIGREVVTLLNEEKQQGNYKIKFDGSKLASGIYFYRMQAGNFVKTKKLILIK